MVRSPWLWIGLAIAGIPAGFVAGWFLFHGVFTVFAGHQPIGRQEESVGLPGGLIGMTLGFGLPVVFLVIIRKWMRPAQQPPRESDVGSAREAVPSGAAQTSGAKVVRPRWPSRWPWGTIFLVLVAAMAFLVWLIPLFLASSFSLQVYRPLVMLLLALSGIGGLAGLLVIIRRRGEIASRSALWIVPATLACAAIFAHSVMTMLELRRAASIAECLVKLKDVAGAYRIYRLEHGGKAPSSLNDLHPYASQLPWICPATGKPFALDFKKMAETQTVALTDEGCSQGAYWFRKLLVTGFSSSASAEFTKFGVVTTTTTAGGARTIRMTFMGEVHDLTAPAGGDRTVTTVTMGDVHDLLMHENYGQDTNEPIVVRLDELE